MCLGAKIHEHIDKKSKNHQLLANEQEEEILMKGLTVIDVWLHLRNLDSVKIRGRNIFRSSKEESKLFGCKSCEDCLYQFSCIRK